MIYLWRTNFITYLVCSWWSAVTREGLCQQECNWNWIVRLSSEWGRASSFWMILTSVLFISKSTWLHWVIDMIQHLCPLNIWCPRNHHYYIPNSKLSCMVLKYANDNTSTSQPLIRCCYLQFLATVSSGQHSYSSNHGLSCKYKSPNTIFMVILLVCYATSSMILTSHRSHNSSIQRPWCQRSLNL